MRTDPRSLTADPTELDASEALAARGGGPAARHPLDIVIRIDPPLPVMIVPAGFGLTGVAP
ncbi:MAG: hypothetical protein IRZ00_14770 [Gemmatimonadetes bacterium]|nr:hypothetical protein [Gemmatimonadota bacterium]